MSQELEVRKLNQLIGGKRKLYHILSQIYVLPDMTSHACTVDYLMKYTQDPVEVYTCSVQETQIFKVRHKSHSAIELFDKLEGLLRSKGMEPTGMNALALPDVNWLCTVLHKEDPTDELNIFGKKNSVTVKRKLNEKYILL